MKKGIAKSVSLLILAAGLVACSTTEKKPAVSAAADVKIIMRASGMPMPVTFSASTNVADCKVFEKVGNTADYGQGKVLPWIAKLQKNANKAVGTQDSLMLQATAGKPVQIKAYGSWSDSNSSGHCGPLTTKFTPPMAGTYLVDFQWSGVSACAIRVSEQGAPDRQIKTQMLDC